MNGMDGETRAGLTDARACRYEGPKIFEIADCPFARARCCSGGVRGPSYDTKRDMTRGSNAHAHAPDE